MVSSQFCWVTCIPEEYPCTQNELYRPRISKARALQTYIQTDRGDRKKLSHCFPVYIDVWRLVNQTAAYKLHVKQTTRQQLLYASFDTAITSVYYHGNLKGNYVTIDFSTVMFPGQYRQPNTHGLLNSTNQIFDKRLSGWWWAEGEQSSEAFLFLHTTVVKVQQLIWWVPSDRQWHGQRSTQHPRCQSVKCNDHDLPEQLLGCFLPLLDHILRKICAIQNVNNVSKIQISVKYAIS